MEENNLTQLNKIKKPIKDSSILFRVFIGIFGTIVALLWLSNNTYVMYNKYGHELITVAVIVGIIINLIIWRSLKRRQIKSTSLSEANQSFKALAIALVIVFLILFFIIAYSLKGFA